MRFVFGAFIVLHGLVHLLYFAQSARYFELKQGMVWPDGSWAFSRLLGNGATRNLASVALVVVAVAMMTGGVGLLLSQAWWRPLVVGASALSAIVYVLLWNGTTQNLDGQGLVGLLIDIAILVTTLIFSWPATP